MSQPRYGMFGIGNTKCMGEEFNVFFMMGILAFCRDTGIMCIKAKDPGLAPT